MSVKTLKDDTEIPGAHNHVFDTKEAADAAMYAFLEDVSKARDLHKVTSVGVVVSAYHRDESGEEDANMNLGSLGNMGHVCVMLRRAADIVAKRALAALAGFGEKEAEELMAM